jgi:predicted Na+-dependent transporter
MRQALTLTAEDLGLNSAVVFAVLGAGILAGCQTAPIELGGPPQIVMSNAKAIMIEYSASHRSTAAQLATTHCQKYGKAAVPTVVDAPSEKVVKSQTYECR